MNAKHLKELANNRSYIIEWYLDRLVLWNQTTQRQITIPLPAKICSAMERAYKAGQRSAREEMQRALKGE